MGPGQQIIVIVGGECSRIPAWVGRMAGFTGCGNADRSMVWVGCLVIGRNMAG